MSTESKSAEWHGVQLKQIKLTFIYTMNPEREREQNNAENILLHSETENDSNVIR